jgi:hypothetical protein
MPASRDTNERRQAIWPWLLMPLVVLLVAYTLHDYHETAKTAAQARGAHSEATGEASEP